MKDRDIVCTRGPYIYRFGVVASKVWESMSEQDRAVERLGLWLRDRRTAYIAALWHGLYIGDGRARTRADAACRRAVKRNVKIGDEPWLSLMPRNP